MKDYFFAITLFNSNISVKMNYVNDSVINPFRLTPSSSNPSGIIELYLRVRINFINLNI